MKCPMKMRELSTTLRRSIAHLRCAALIRLQIRPITDKFESTVPKGEGMGCFRTSAKNARTNTVRAFFHYLWI